MQLTDELVTKLGMWVGIPIMIGFLTFIMWDIAKKSKAGRFGTMMIFTILGAGIAVFVIKEGMVYFMDKRIESKAERTQ